MKWSRYNYFYRSKKINKWILYNSVSGALIALDEKDYNQLRSIKKNPDLVHQYSNSDELIDAHILVEKDDTAIDRMKLRILQNRLSNDILDMTIAPTLACNFKCTYCFQRELPSYVMSEETEKNLVRFIKSLSRNGQSLRITWFGGEPLLALNRMESICRRIRAEVKLAIESHVITNGYLLNDATIKILAELGATFYQITIDGLEEIHNRRRPLCDKKGTFQTIVENIETLVSQIDKIEVAIRINVDSENMEEYHKVYSYIRDRFAGRSIRVYAGFVDNYSFSCRSMESCNLDRHERAKFLLDQFEKHGIYSDKFYPIINYDSCLARFINSYVVGPQGDLYKCLSLLGVKEMAIGNVNSDDDIIANEDLLVEFLKGNDYLDSPECNQCFLFPVCDGGCPYLKMKEELFGEVHDTCHVAKGNIDKFLEMHINLRAEQESKAESKDA